MGGELQQLTLTALAIAAVVSFIAFIAAARALPNARWLQKIGSKMHDQKMAQLARPPLSWYQVYVDRKVFYPGLAIIAIMILLKSLVSGLFGLIVIFYLPLGVATIPALAEAHGDQPGLKQWAARVTFMQTLSHLLAAGLGFGATWIWLRSDQAFSEILGSAPTFVWTIIAASVITGIAAAWIETDGHMRSGYL